MAGSKISRRWLNEELEYAWAAGFIDGDGYFSCRGNFNSRGEKVYYPYLAASQREKEPIDRLERLLGGTVRLMNPRHNVLSNKPYYRWILNSRALAQHIDRLYPHLTTVKQEQYQRNIVKAYGGRV